MRVAIGVCAYYLSLGAFAFGQVSVPEGFEVIEFANAPGSKALPDMNNCGQVIFTWRLGGDYRSNEVFIYDNGHVYAVTDNDDCDYTGEINDQGSYVFARCARGGEELILSQEGVDRVIAFNRKGFILGRAINELSHVAWGRLRSDQCPIEGDIMLWAGGESRRISPRKLLEQVPSMNNLGEIAYMRTDECVNPWRGTIDLYSNGETITLPSNQTQVQGPGLNNLGHVVWDAGPVIELYRDGQTEAVFNSGSVPDINDLDDVYVAGWDNALNRWQPWLLRFSEDPYPRRYRLAEDPYSVGRGAVNNWGEVMWIGHDYVGERTDALRFLRRIRTGDSDFDGAIDLRDHRAFAGCMTGPGRVDGLCNCRFLDVDYDGDVDLADFARFQNRFGGP